VGSELNDLVRPDHGGGTTRDSGENRKMWSCLQTLNKQFCLLGIKYRGGVKSNFVPKVEVESSSSLAKCTKISPNAPRPSTKAVPDKV
jgi:hypothetical protein